MVYVPKNWADLPATSTPITAEELERIEQGIADISIELGDAAQGPDADVAARLDRLEARMYATKTLTSGDTFPTDPLPGDVHVKPHA